MNTIYLNSDFTKGRTQIEYEDALQLLDNLQTFLDGTHTPSEALDNLYTHVINTRRAIIHEMENNEND
jgi:hypothetical protein